MPRRERDDVAQRTLAVTGRTLLLAGGFGLAGLATLAVFLTDNPHYLRVAVVAVAWAFVLATFAAGRRGTDRIAATAREAELRRAYELELEREVAARREYELELENRLRRETEDAMRYDLDALRGDIAGLAGLRDEVARVSELRGDIAALSGLRHDLGQLSELRGEMGRLRAELTEQLSSEMLVERIVMRTQGSRLPSEPTRLDSGRWNDDVPPRELTGGWPAVRLDEPRETQQFEQVRPDRAGLRPSAAAPEPVQSWRAPSWENLTREAPVGGSRPRDTSLPSWDSAGTGTYVRPAAPPPFSPPAFSPAPADDWWAAPPAPEASAPDHDDAEPWSRHSTDEVAGLPAATAFPIAPSSIARPPAVEPPAPSPLDWLAARSLLDEPLPRTSLPEVPPRPRSTDEQPTADDRSAQRPAVLAGSPPLRMDDRGGYRVAVHPPQPPAHREPPTEGNRLAEILAENGVTPAGGGRRRRRYRDEDEPDDVLARVLGRH